MAEAGGLYYEWHGPEDAPPLILSSGLGGAASYWAPNLPALTERYRVLVYDHHGTGRSPGSLPESLTIANMSEELLALMDALAIGRASIMGHALGGLIGLDLALTHSRVDRVVVINAWDGMDGLDPHTARCFDVRLDLLRNVGPAAYLKAQPLFLYPAGWISTHTAELTAEAEHQLAHFPPREVIERRIAALRAWQLWIDFGTWDKLLIIGTADDMLVPVEASRRLAASMCDDGTVQYAEMKWGGHACNVTDPDTFNRIVLDFLRS